MRVPEGKTLIIFGLYPSAAGMREAVEYQHVMLVPCREFPKCEDVEEALNAAFGHRYWTARVQSSHVYGFSVCNIQS